MKFHGIGRHGRLTSPPGCVVLFRAAADSPDGNRRIGQRAGAGHRSWPADVNFHGVRTVSVLAQGKIAAATRRSAILD